MWTDEWMTWREKAESVYYEEANIRFSAEKLWVGYIGCLYLFSINNTCTSNYKILN